MYFYIKDIKFSRFDKQSTSHHTHHPNQLKMIPQKEVSKKRKNKGKKSLIKMGQFIYFYYYLTCFKNRQWMGWMWASNDTYKEHLHNFSVNLTHSITIDEEKKRKVVDAICTSRNKKTNISYRCHIKFVGPINERKYTKRLGGKFEWWWIWAHFLNWTPTFQEHLTWLS